MPANLPKRGEQKIGPLIEGSRVVRRRFWGGRATRWVYAESRQAVQTYGLMGLVARLFIAASVLAVLISTTLVLAYTFLA